MPVFMVFQMYMYVMYVECILSLVSIYIDAYLYFYLSFSLIYNLKKVLMSSLCVCALIDIDNNQIYYFKQVVLTVHVH